MITQVKYLQEALQRFSPEARLTYELNVQGISPATECNVTPAGFDWIEFKTCKEERGELEARCDELLDGLEAIEAECKKMPDGDGNAILEKIRFLTSNEN